MPAIDFLTSLISYLVTYAICAVVLGLLWWQNRATVPATREWFISYLCQCGSITAFALRGQVPEVVPTMIGGLLVLAALLALRRGLDNFLGLPARHYGLYIALFVVIHAWFTWGDPVPRLRNLNICLAYLVLLGETPYRMVRHAARALRPSSTVVAGVLALLLLFNLITFVRLLLADPISGGVGPQGSVVALMIIATQITGISLAVSLVLLVNRQLHLDMTHELAQRRVSEAALRQSEERLKRAEQIAKLGHWEMNFKEGSFDGSSGCEAIYGGRKEDYDYHTMRAMPLAEHIPAISAAMQRTVQEGAPYDIEFQIRTLDSGAIKDIHSLGSYDAARGIMFGVIQDITERKHAERELRVAASVFRHAQEGIAIMDPAGKFLDINTAFTDITGYTAADALGRNVREFNPPEMPPEEFDSAWAELLRDGFWHGEVIRKRKSDERYTMLYTVSAVRHTNGEVAHYVAFFTDISEQKKQRQLLEQMAHFDTLTGLPNRSLLADRLQTALAQSQRRSLPVAVAYLDLDGFKLINDSMGHDVGDELLVELATRMKQALRDGDTLARVGGDEFIALLVDLRDTGECEQIVRRLLTAAATPVERHGQVCRVSASIGVTLYPLDDADADLLVRHADQAMYEAKRLGKNQFQFWRLNR